MRFQVPQFIERDIKVVGPLTFKQVIIVGAGVLVCTFFYFLIAPKSFFLFIVLSLPVMGVSFALAVGQSGGQSLLTVISNFFVFTFSSRKYLWKKKAVTPKLFVPTKVQEKPQQKLEATISQKKSRLENLSSQLEIGGEDKKQNQ